MTVQQLVDKMLEEKIPFTAEIMVEDSEYQDLDSARFYYNPKTQQIVVCGYLPTPDSDKITVHN